jgi:hypothetical protein
MVALGRPRLSETAVDVESDINVLIEDAARTEEGGSISLPQPVAYRMSNQLISPERAASASMASHGRLLQRFD